MHGRPERVGELTAEALGAIGIPTLADVLALAGREPFLDVEFKGDPGPAAVEALVVGQRPASGGSATLVAAVADGVGERATQSSQIGCTRATGVC